MWIKNLSFEDNYEIILIAIESVNAGIAVCALYPGLGECVFSSGQRQRELRTEGAVAGPLSV